MASKKNEVAVIEESKALVAAGDAYGEDVGAGFEEISAEDLVIARISILQKMSPQVDSDNQAYVEGAKAGKLINSVTGALYDKEGFTFVPVHRTHEFLEFVPRDAGGGFKGAHAPESDVIVRARAAVGGSYSKLKTAEGNDLIETFQVYGLLVDKATGDYQVAVLSFSSSNIKTYKRWMTMARAVTMRTEDGRRITLPLFAHMYRVSTQYQENAKGSWYSYQVGWEEANAEASRLSPDHELYQAAKLARDMVTSGAARTSFNEGGEGGSGNNEVDDVF